MKEIITLICALALAKADLVRTNIAPYDKANPQHARFICATKNSDNILIAHEVCNKFYQCWNGEPVVRNCYGNLQYNPITDVCDWPYTVECGERLLEEESSSEYESSGSGDGGTDNAGFGTCKCNPAEAPEICAAEGSDGILIAHETCCDYYKCDNGKPVTISCPAGLLYNPHIEQCDWPENVECGERVIPEPGTGGNNNGNGDSGNGDPENGGSGNGEAGTCNCNPAEAPNVCAADGSDGVLIAHENCCKFYKCDNGKPVSISCPAGLLYNPYKEVCDWPEDVQCGDRVIPKPVKPEGGGGNNENGGDNNGGSDNGNSENGGSGNGGSENGGSGTCNCNPAEAPELCAAAGSDGVLIAHKNCCQFYKCDNGRPITMSCPGGLLYNPYTEQCDWPENVECGDRVILELESGEDNNENGGSDNGNGGSDNNGDSGNGGTDNVDPGTCNCNPAEAPKTCAASGSDGILIAHENCNQFYKCDHGRPVTISCAGGLLYNPYKEVCDWPEDVQCGDRVIPKPVKPEGGGGNNENGGDNNGGSDNGNSENGGSGNGGSENGGSGRCNCNPAEAPELCAAAGSDGILIAHKNCCQFYKCDNGRPITMSCPGGLLYNPYTEQCDWPENVECGDRVILELESGEDNNENGGSENGNGGSDNNGDSGNGGTDNVDPGTCNCNPAEAPKTCAASGSDGILIAHENCNQFYKCDHGRPVTISCARGLLYNPYKEVCDWPEDVQCGDRVIPKPVKPEGGGGNNENGGDNNGGSDNGNSENGGSGNSGSENGGSGTCNCNPAEAPELCAAAGSDGVLIAHKNCCQFYKCDNGRPITMSCPGGLLYNPYTEQCDWPENVECGDRVILELESGEDNNENGGSDNGNGGSDNNGDSGNGGTDNVDPGTCNCNPAEAPKTCTASGSDGILIAHENCNQFYKCDHGRPVTISCAGGLLYNPYKEVCDWPEDVQCGDRVIPKPVKPEGGGGNNENGGDNNGGSDNGNSENGGSGNGGSENGGSGTCNCNPAEAPELCAAAGSDGVLIAHKNCCQFYKCDNGRPITMSCPGGLLYNPYTEQCDWPENVECGDRVILELESGEDNNENGGSDNGNGGSDNNGDSGNGSTDNVDPGTCNCNPAEAPKTCAASGSDGILIAHENCNQFYKCDHGRPVTISCAGGLLYNPYKEVCDWPEDVQCGDRVIPKPVKPEGGGGNNENGGDNNGGSDNGNSENGGSGNGGSENGGSGTCNCNPAEAPELCATAGSDGILIAHKNCCQFYKCDNGRPITMSCPGGLLYNPYTEQCDWPENVECGDRVILELESGEDNNENGGSDNGNGGSDNNGDSGNGGIDNVDPGTCNCNPAEALKTCAAIGSDGILIAHENCNQFYKCDHGRPVTISCAGGLLYNPYKEVCDWPEDVQCGDRVIPKPVKPEGGGGNNENGGDNNGGSDNGNSENGGSGNGGSENGGSGTCNCNPAEAPELCAAAGSDGILIAHKNCCQFYKCDNGRPITMSCPGGLLYNPYTEQCDWPENVECGDRVILELESGEDNNENGGSDNGNGGSDNNGDSGNGGTDNVDPGTCNCNPAEAPKTCAASGSDGILIAHENCNQFYKCDHGRPVTISCAGGLLYNPYKEVCDWPEDVQCGDRVIPKPVKPEGGGGNNENGGDNNGGSDNGNSENGGSGNGGSENGGSGTCNCNPAEAPELCATAGSDGILIAHKNCCQFYKCDNGRPITMSCPGGLLYNPYTEQCDWPENVECGDRVILELESGEDNNENGGSDNGNGGSDNNGDSGNGGIDNVDPGTCNCNPAEAPKTCAAIGSDGILIAHENCNQFYKCDHGRPVTISCAGGLLYNPYKEVCDWPEDVQCGDRVIPKPVKPEGGGGNNENGGDNNGGSDNGNSENGGSGNGGSENGGSGTCNCNPAEAPELCAAAGSDGVLIAHKNCCQFYKCDNGRPITMSCPGGLLYNPYTEQCDWPENVECGDRVILELESGEDNNENGGSDNGNGGSDNNGDSGNGGTDNVDPGTCNCNPAEAPKTCAASGSDGILIAHENCNQFYKCDHGRPVTISCAGGLLYNPYKEVCDWPEDVQCGDRVIPKPVKPEGGGGNNENGGDNNGGSDNGNSENGGSGNGGSENGGSGTCNCNPAEAPELCAAAGSDGVLIAHKNCCQFYKCDNGRPITMSCPGGLLYNPYTEQCDWPENVECGDRVILELESGEDNNENGGSENGNGGSDNNGDSGNGGTDNVDPGTCNCNPAEAPKTCAASGSDGILIAHENCNQFYKCDHGRPVTISCAGGLLYNPYKEVCDWPEDVQCGDRVIPKPVKPEGGGGNNENGGDNNGGSDNGNSENGGSGNGGSENGGSGTCNCNPAEAPELCAAAGSDGILIAHKNCCQFYKCDNGRPITMSCPGGLLYNPYTEQCDWPENVECGDRVILELESGEDNNENGGSDNGNGGSDNNGDSGNGGTDNVDPGTCNCNPAEAPKTCAASASDGILIAHENCNQFYKCDHGRPVTISCAGGLLYNPYKEVCDWPEDVQCGDRVIPKPVKPEGGGGNNENGGDNNGGSDNGNSENGGSGNGGSENGGSGTCNCKPAEAPKVCSADGSDGAFVAHESCNQFYTCVGGRPVTMTCPGSLLYNPYTEVCDWPEYVKCGDRVIPKPDNGEDNNGNGGSDNNGDSDNNGGSDNGNSGISNCNPAEAPKVCAADGSDGLLIAHENCCKFYKCANGRPVSVSCPSGLFYNPYTEECDWPENVKCGDRFFPKPGSGGDNDGNGGDNNGASDNGNTGNGSEDSGNGVTDNVDLGVCNCNPAEAPKVCAADGSDGAFVAHENCNQFYTCVGGRPVTMTCPGSLLYNPYTEVCDWPEYVKCGDRVIPKPDNGEDNNGNGGADNNGDSDNNGGSDNGNSGTCNCNPAEAPKVCAADGSDGLLIAHENCCKFYKCANRRPVSVSCPDGLFYNPYTEECDWPENVECSGRVIPAEVMDDVSAEAAGNDGSEADNGDSNIDFGYDVAVTACADLNSAGAYVPHEQCHRFYICLSRRPVVFTCSSNHLYDIGRKQCNYREMVDCSNRILLP